MAAIASDDIIRLRPHHVFGCILTWSGGPAYEPDFDRYFSDIVTRINRPPPATIEIVEGPDDACKILGRTQPPEFRKFIYHCERPDILERDRKVLAEMSKWLTQRQPHMKVDLPLKIGQRLVLDEDLLKAFREGFAQGATRAGCRGCVYEECTRSAEKGFQGALLKIGVL